MFPHMAMSQSLRPPNPLDPYSSYAAAAAMDPFRLELLGRDPYREAREREQLMRLSNPLGSLVNSAELERAKAQALGLTASYPSLPSAYPGYPPTTLAAAANASLAAHKMNMSPHLSSLYSQPGLHHGLPGYPSSPLYPPAPLNGVPGHAAGQYNGKDPLRR